MFTKLLGWQVLSKFKVRKEVAHMSTKRELQEENETLRQKLEEAYDVIGDALGFQDNVAEDEDQDPDALGEDDED